VTVLVLLLMSTLSPLTPRLKPLISASVFAAANGDRKPFPRLTEGSRQRKALFRFPLRFSFVSLAFIFSP
jgi:hypothetical protein